MSGDDHRIAWCWKGVMGARDAWSSASSLYTCRYVCVQTTWHCTCKLVCVYICVVRNSWGGGEKERKGEVYACVEYMYGNLMSVPTILPLQVLYRGSSCVTIHLSPTHRVGGVAVLLPLVQGSILVGSLGADCSQCSQSQGASLCTAHCTHCISLCRYVFMCTSYFK